MVNTSKQKDNRMQGSKEKTGCCRIMCVYAGFNMKSIEIKHYGAVRTLFKMEES